MSGNVCGNCSNFKPKPGDKVFNCLVARHAGVTYGMQVRKDTASCDAFAPLKASAPAPSKKIAQPAPQSRKEPPSRARLCSWGRLLLITALLIALILVAFGIYTCAGGLRSKSSPTPTTAPSPTSTSPGGLPLPSTTPVPIPTLGLVERLVGQSATAAGEVAIVNSVYKSGSRPASIGSVSAPAGTVYVVVSVTVLNVGTSGFMIGPQYFLVVDSDGNRYYGSSVALTLGLSNTFELNPGTTVHDNLYFVVPTSATGIKVYHRFPNTQLIVWVSSL